MALIVCYPVNGEWLQNPNLCKHAWQEPEQSDAAAGAKTAGEKADVEELWWEKLWTRRPALG